MFPRSAVIQCLQEQERLEAGIAWENAFDLVFTTKLGKPLNERNITSSFHRYLEAAGLARMRFYDMRHTCGALLIAQGVHPRVVMEILGHSQISITMNIYGHVIPKAKDDAADRLDDLLK